MNQSSLVDFQVHLGAHPAHETRNDIKIDVEDLSFWYGEKQALDRVNLKVHRHEVTALVGPSGCGKTTFLRCLNRTNDPELVPHSRMEGSIRMEGQDIYDPALDPPLVRRRFGWVAQRPNPFPWSIYENVAYGPRIHGIVHDRHEADTLVEQTLMRAGLWDEVKDRLGEPATDLSGGQQQRLCVARAISTAPEVILMDEPASALDPTATAGLEDLIDELRPLYTIVIITHNMQQAARVSQRIAMFHLGRMVEAGDAADIFLKPKDPLTEAYVTGRFG